MKKGALLPVCQKKCFADCLAIYNLFNQVTRGGSKILREGYVKKGVRLPNFTTAQVIEIPHENEILRPQSGV